MANYKDILATYVVRLGQNQAIRLGEARESDVGAVPAFGADDKARLTAQLEDQCKRNQILIWVASALWILLFAVAIYFALHYRDNLRGLSVALGGNLMVVGGVMMALRRLWLDASSMGALLAILPGLAPNEAAKVITSFYLNAIHKDSGNTHGRPKNRVP